MRTASISGAQTGATKPGRLPMSLFLASAEWTGSRVQPRTIATRRATSPSPAAGCGDYIHMGRTAVWGPMALGRLDVARGLRRRRARTTARTDAEAPISSGSTKATATARGTIVSSQLRNYNAGGPGRTAARSDCGDEGEDGDEDGDSASTEVRGGYGVGRPVQ